MAIEAKPKRTSFTKTGSTQQFMHEKISVNIYNKRQMVTKTGGEMFRWIYDGAVCRRHTKMLYTNLKQNMVKYILYYFGYLLFFSGGPLQKYMCIIWHYVSRAYEVKQGTIQHSAPSTHCTDMHEHFSNYNKAKAISRDEQE